MEILLFLVIGGFLCITVIVTWLNRGAITALEDEQRKLRLQLRQLLERDAPAHIVVPVTEVTSGPPPRQMSAGAAESAVPEFDWGDEPITPPHAMPRRDASDTGDTGADQSTLMHKESFSFEQQFGARLPVWIGGLALILAGFFLVKYSIEAGLLSPTVRVVIGLLFGGGLLSAAHYVRRKSLAGGTRIAQALAGAALADLYICLFAASSLYELIPAWLGLLGMAAVTVGAVFLALEHGMPIALLGLLGGFVTPALISTGHPNGLLLFSYLYALVAGFLYVSRHYAWWFLALPTLGCAFLWSGIWLFSGYFVPTDTLWLGLFLLATSATVLRIHHQHLAQDMQDQSFASLGFSTLALHFGTVMGAIILMALVMQQAGFSPLDWGMFGVLTVGGLALAYCNQKLYGLVPWLTLLANNVMLLAWHTAENGRYGWTLGCFAALYAAAGYGLQARSARPLLWAALVTASSLISYLIVYFKLHAILIMQGISLFWGGLALGLAFAAVEIVRRLAQQIPLGHPQRVALLSLYAATATAFVALALTIELEHEFLALAFALEMTALCWLHQRFALPALRQLAAIMALGFAALSLPQLIEQMIERTGTAAVTHTPVLYLGLPALCFALGSIFLRQRQDDKTVLCFERAAVALLATMGYFILRCAFHGQDAEVDETVGFIERGVITNFFFFYGLGCCWWGRRLERDSIAVGGLALCGLALLRVVGLDGLLLNPLWEMQDVGAWPLFNGLLLTYGFPVLWLWLLIRQWPSAMLAYLKPAQAWLYAAMLGLVFIGLSLHVRQFYHGAFLSVGSTSNAEIYSYSAAWLSLGVVLLGLGTWRHMKMLRVAALFLMILTVGKVFLYDAAALTGLYRVFSFFGLGASLLALSWFYARFIAVDQKK